MVDWRLPLSDLDYGEAERNAVLRVLQSKWLSMGPEVQAFEHEFAAMQGVKHAFAVSSATAGLHLAFLATEITAGDEVIQPALNFVATANMTVACGARPVFADITSPTEPTIDAASVERLITPRTKVVVVMHYGGNLCRMAELQALCRQHSLVLIEDACHAVGARYLDALERPPHGAMAGSIGDVGTFSFYANKNMATGEGGIVVTDRDDVAERARLLRSHGMTSPTWDRHRGHASTYGVVSHGYNYRLDELHAALGRAQLAKLEANNARRRGLLRLYRNRLRAEPSWSMPFGEDIDRTSGHLMVALAPDCDARARAVDRLTEARIQSSLHYPCIADFEAFQMWQASHLPNTRDYVARAITLPLYPSMEGKLVEIVCDVLATSAPSS